MKIHPLLYFLLLWIVSCSRPAHHHDHTHLILSQKEDGSIEVLRERNEQPILVQVAKADFRPYIHPIVAPDGKGILTEYSPGHHKHQTGLYWGFTSVNGRDYFHHNEGDYWQKVAANLIESEGEQVSWQTVYRLLDAQGAPILEETMTWTMREEEGKYFLDLEWKGEALEDIRIGQYDYGSLFLRMPWREGIAGEVTNAARQKNNQAEGQPAMWVNVSMQVEGREDLAHVAIFDHPENRGYPNKWRVDGQLGVGPAFTRDGDWDIPKGKAEKLKHQLVIYTGEFNDVKLTETWSAFSGKSGMYSTTELWQLAQQEGRDAKFLSPREAVEAMTVKAGYQVNVWAAEPMMSQPMAFCWDDRGRLWIAENKDYESRGYGFSSSGESRILILEDTDGDGVADSRKVFLEGIAFPAAIAVGFDGLYLGAPPNLLFVPDRDGDDKADMDKVEILLTGWGILDRHETLNSLHWGPDGWLYGLQGFATPSKIRKPNKDTKLYYKNDPFPENLLEAEGVDINGGVWRYHPTKDRFEVVAHGFSNPWGIDYDAKGQLLMTACVIPHLWHVVPGGIYHRQGGKHFNPYVYEDIKTIADHSHRSAHGGARVYQSDAFPKDQQGRIFMANIHEHAVLSDILVPEGSGYRGKHGDDFLVANNAQWVGFSMEIGPDGGLYVLDWHDADICGKEVLNEETGRIFRIMPEKSLAQNFEGRYSDLNKMTDSQLVNLQLSPSDWHSRRARGILHKRAAKGKLSNTTHQELRQIFQKEKNPDYRLRAMWALHITSGFSKEELVKSLSDKDPHVRAWAIQLLCEDHDPGEAALAKFRSMAAEDKSAVVRLYLSAALQRIPNATKWPIAQALTLHGEDARDHNLPKMLWYGIEPLLAADPDRFMQLASASKVPMLTQFMARRAVDGDELQRLVAQIAKGGPNTKDLMQGMHSGMEGRTDLTVPANWQQTAQKLAKGTPEVQRLAQDISALFGDTEATQRALATLKNKAAPAEQRVKALQMLSAQQRPELQAILPALLEEVTLRSAAIRAVAAFDSDNLGKLLLDRYSKWDREEKQEAIQALSSRSRYGHLLTAALKSNKIPKTDIQPNMARQLHRVVGSGFIEYWGPIEQVASDAAAYAKYRQMISQKALASADPKAGKRIFANTCGSCHKMYGEGGIIGPDLTGSNRTDPEYILLNVLEPSAEIQEDYRLVMVNTRDGRTYSGNVIAENERQITMRVVGQDPVTINKSSIQNKEVTPVSLMPPGLFEQLSEKEIVDLMAYLKTNRKLD